MKYIGLYDHFKGVCLAPTYATPSITLCFGSSLYLDESKTQRLLITIQLLAIFAYKYPPQPFHTH